MRRSTGESGFTVVELLVVMSLFAVASVGFYTVLLATRDGGVRTQELAEVSEQARAGLNRMVRDTREAVLNGGLTVATPTSYTVRVDFDGDGAYNPLQYEVVTYAFNAGSGTITISNGTDTEAFISGVEQIGSTDVFSYSSNRLEYDANNDGITTIPELDLAEDSGATLTPDKLPYVTTIAYAFRVRAGNSVSTFYTQAQLRNRR